MLVLTFVLVKNDLGIGKSEVQNEIIKVVIYNGTEADSNCVEEVENCLDNANAKNLTGNVKLDYNTTDVINTETLSSYDVLLMPGGSGGADYLNSENIDSESIENFVYHGKGYVGICAGAYSAAAYTEDWYDGWGIAPDVYAAHPMDEENTTIQITSLGQQIFGESGQTTMSHENGPAIYSSGGNIITFVTYADNVTGYQGYGAIVGDYYGKGRTVLSGVHPELTPQHPDMVANMILWAAGLKSID